MYTSYDIVDYTPKSQALRSETVARAMVMFDLLAKCPIASMRTSYDIVDYTPKSQALRSKTVAKAMVMLELHSSNIAIAAHCHRTYT